MLRIEHDKKVTVLKLDRGIPNPIDLEMVRELDQALREVKQNPEIQGLVLSSANEKIFSLGFNLPVLFPQSREDFQTFFQAFNRFCLDLFTLPKPTAAALTGHAVAGGCILAISCDLRFIAEGKKSMGLNEVKLGVPVPYVTDRILHQIVGTRKAREILESGDFYLPPVLLEMGLVDRVLPAGEVLPRAVEKIAALGALPPPAFAEIKKNRTEKVVEQILRHREEKDKIFLDLWYAPETRERIKQAMENFK
ncbi:MAG: enoyl-CoA hydratase/isomerase family protein [Proteobacteria bacterium]|nr:enoyl-CoA hydratase/isomerase family protein [Pseudomonadota bacterium]